MYEFQSQTQPRSQGYLLPALWVGENPGNEVVSNKGQVCWGGGGGVLTPLNPPDPPLTHHCNLVVGRKSLVSRDESLVLRDG